MDSCVELVGTLAAVPGLHAVVAARLVPTLVSILAQHRNEVRASAFSHNTAVDVLGGRPGLELILIQFHFEIHDSRVGEINRVDS